MKSKTKSRKSVVEEKKVLGIGTNIKNILIAIALIFAFLGGFFGVYNWIDNTYGKKAFVEKVKIENDYRWETTVLNGMYSRFHVLDSIISFAMDPTKVDPDRRQEFNELKSKIKLQEEKVKVLQEKTCNK
jgi:hypothetical protein